MKALKTIGLLSMFILATGILQPSLADDKGSTPDQDKGWFCPWAGQGNMGPGMMGQGYSGGMMGYGQGYGYGPGGMMGQGRGYGAQHYNRSGKPVTLDQAKVLVEKYVDRMGNPNLKSGKVTDKDKYFESDITTKDGSLVNKLYVDKQTGWMRFEY